MLIKVVEWRVRYGVRQRPIWGKLPLTQIQWTLSHGLWKSCKCFAEHYLFIQICESVRMWRMCVIHYVCRVQFKIDTFHVAIGICWQWGNNRFRCDAERPWVCRVWPAWSAPIVSCKAATQWVVDLSSDLAVLVITTSTSAEVNISNILRVYSYEIFKLGRHLLTFHGHLQVGPQSVVWESVSK